MTSHVALFWIFGRRGVMFVGYTCESGITVVQSESDHGQDKLSGTTFRQKRTNQRNFPDRKERSTAEAIVVMFY